MAWSLHQYSPRTQVLACALVSILGGAAAWKGLIGPESEALALRRARLAVVAADVERATLGAKQLPDVQRRVAELEGELHRLTDHLPSDHDAQLVLRRLQAFAMDGPVSITGFVPKPVAERATHVERPMELTLEGGFHALSRFFEGLATDSRLISVSNLHVRGSPRPVDDRPGGLLASCTATILVFRPEIQP